MALNEDILDLYPTPIAGAYARFIDEREAGVRYDALLSLFEAQLKYLAISAIQQHLQSGDSDAELSKSLAMLRRPSLGHWAGLLRSVLKRRLQLRLPDEEFVFPELPDLYHSGSPDLQHGLALLRQLQGKNPSKLPLAQLFDLLVEQRNSKAHGVAQPATYFAERVGFLQPVLEELLLAIPSLVKHELRYGPVTNRQIESGSSLRIMSDHPRLRQRLERSGFSETPGIARLSIVSANEVIVLDPLMVLIQSCAECGEPQVGIINGEGRSGVEYLCYACGHTNKLDPATADPEGFLGRFVVQSPPELAEPQYETPNNLPEQPTSFVGRTTELKRAQELLLQGARESRLLTLIGPGGVGKTRLALRLAESVLPHFPDGVYLVALATITDPALVIPTIAEVLGVRDTGEEPLQKTLEHSLADKRMLLVLDNFEHLLAAGGQLAQLLARTSQLELVVTSRSALRLTGEQEYVIPPLTTLKNIDHLSLADLASNDAVALFVQRAQLVDSRFALSDKKGGNAQAVGEITRRLDGLPLAIELAAARIKMLTPAQIVTRLNRRFDLLSGGARNAPEKQQTMRAAIDWSYGLLVEPERVLLRRMAVFLGGCTLEEAQAVCNADLLLPADLLDNVEALVNDSLLVRQEAEYAGLPGIRFTMLETIREYALDRLQQSGEEEELRKQHTNHFLGVAETADAAQAGPEQDEWLARLDTEHDNLRHALSWATEQADGETALRLSAALWHFWETRGYLSEGLDWLDRALGQSGAAPVKLRARAVRAAGILAADYGKIDRAKELFAENLKLRREINDETGVAQALSNLGTLAHMQGDCAQARELFEECLIEFNRLKDEYHIAVTLHNLALVAYDEDRFAEAAQLLEESLAISRAIGDTQGIDWALISIGDVMRQQGDLDRAAQLYKERLLSCRDRSDQQGIALCLERLAYVAIAAEAWDRAAILLGAADALRRKIDLPIEAAEIADHETAIAAANARVDAQRWQARWQAGSSMPVEQAINIALADG